MQVSSGLPREDPNECPVQQDSYCATLSQPALVAAGLIYDCGLLWNVQEASIHFGAAPCWRCAWRSHLDTFALVLGLAEGVRKPPLDKSPLYLRSAWLDPGTATMRLLRPVVEQ